MSQIRVDCWAIALTKDVSGPQTPVFFYNHHTDIWVRGFQSGCAFLTEDEADAKLYELCVAADIVKGHTMVPA